MPALQNEVTDLFDAPIEPLGEDVEATADARIEPPQITPPPTRGTSVGNQSSVRTKEDIEAERLQKEMDDEAAALKSQGVDPNAPTSTGTVVAPGPSAAGGQQPPVAGQQQPPAAVPPTPPAATVPVGEMTTAMVAALQAAGLVAPQQQQQTAAPEVPLTQEQIDEQLGVWKPTAEWQQRLLDPDTMPAALAELQAGSVRQSVRMAHALAQEFIQKELGPIQQAIESLRPAAELAERTQSEQALNAFHTRHPLLKDPSLQAIVRLAYQEVKQSGKQFDSRESAFDAIAEKATAVIRAVKPDFGTQAPPTGQPAAPSQQQPTTATATPIPVPPPTGGATGGGAGGGGSASKPPKNEVQDIWDK